ncbi:MAG: acyl-CoA dehydrogenase family protein [Chloroflexi bacterium]|nr:acyl-CoA dehydrogenase family protein [Chloroflexota bacterium]MCY3588865.1 acyl-CoA dehydrogenase family protein [Chloroflexota bacterium]MCY3686175.1 acyl-CoA dehydrogenase family protein [Chloroflexota bacterium]MDE2708796.1 acyl-CoA dehydrogenase family protein [Chloroflexota bacterium]MDE2987864.1 acyl-CoA dehydrogenase family protein [Chloroflexota bacterium]
METLMSEEQRMITQAVKRFVRDEVQPLERDLDPDAVELPPGELDRLKGIVKQMGLYHIDVPEDYGGPGLPLTTRGLVAEEMSQHRAGLYLPCYGAFGSAGLAQLYSASDDQKDRYLYPMLRDEKRAFFGLTEPSGGSDPARAIQTKAVKDGDDWILNGSKLFSSGADRADFGLVFARTDPEKGRRGISAFLVDTDSPGFEVRRVVHTLRSANYGTELSFDDVRVPAANLVGEEGGGFALANNNLTRQRIPYSATCVGIAVAAQEMAISYSQQRETFGAALASRQAIQWMIVDNEIDIRTGRMMYLAAAEKAEQDEPFRFEAAMAKLTSTEGASRVVDRAIQIHGGIGVTKDLPLERWYREMRIRRIGEGPSEVQRIIMARDLLGRGSSG